MSSPEGTDRTGDDAMSAIEAIDALSEADRAAPATDAPADDVLRARVLRRLAALTELAERGPAESLLPLAGTELNRLANGWRLLLTVHQPGPDRRCRACPGSLRRRRWPCRVWLLAYQHLIGERPPRRSRRLRFPPITR